MMNWMEIAKLGKELGLGVCAFALCFYIVRMIMTGLLNQIKELTSSLKTFMAMVKVEHQNQQKEHEALSKQNEEQIKVLGRINGYTHD